MSFTFTATQGNGTITYNWANISVPSGRRIVRYSLKLNDVNANKSPPLNFSPTFDFNNGNWLTVKENFTYQVPLYTLTLGDTYQALFTVHFDNETIFNSPTVTTKVVSAPVLAPSFTVVPLDGSVKINFTGLTEQNLGYLPLSSIHITASSIDTSPPYLNTISHIPTPTSSFPNGEYSYTLTGLVNQKGYELLITYNNAQGPSPSATLNNDNSTVTPTELPNAPENLTVKPNGSNKLKLTWSEPLDRPINNYTISEYWIYRSMDNVNSLPTNDAAAGSPLKKLPGSNVSFIDTELVNGKTYYYKIRAVRQINPSTGETDVTDPNDDGLQLGALSANTIQSYSLCFDNENTTPTVEITPKNAALEIKLTRSSNNTGIPFSDADFYKIVLEGADGLRSVHFVASTDEPLVFTKNDLLNGNEYKVTVSYVQYDTKGVAYEGLPFVGNSFPYGPLSSSPYFISTPVGLSGDNDEKQPLSNETEKGVLKVNWSPSPEYDNAEGVSKYEQVLLLANANRTNSKTQAAPNSPLWVSNNSFTLNDNVSKAQVKTYLSRPGDDIVVKVVLQDNNGNVVNPTNTDYDSVTLGNLPNEQTWEFGALSAGKTYNIAVLSSFSAYAFSYIYSTEVISDKLMKVQVSVSGSLTSTPGRFGNYSITFPLGPSNRMKLVSNQESQVFINNEYIPYYGFTKNRFTLSGIASKLSLKTNLYPVDDVTQALRGPMKAALINIDNNSLYVADGDLRSELTLGTSQNWTFTNIPSGTYAIGVYCPSKTVFKWRYIPVAVFFNNGDTDFQACEVTAETSIAGGKYTNSIKYRLLDDNVVLKDIEGAEYTNLEASDVYLKVNNLEVGKVYDKLAVQSYYYNEELGQEVSSSVKLVQQNGDNQPFGLPKQVPLIQTVPSDSAINVSWSAANGNGLSSPKYLVSLDDGEQVDVGSELSYDGFTELNNGQLYTIGVETYTKFNSNLFNEELTFKSGVKTKSDRPRKPASKVQNLQVYPATARIYAVWDLPEDLGGANFKNYKWQILEGENVVFEDVTTNEYVNQDGLIDGTNYTFKVWLVTSLEYSDATVSSEINGESEVFDFVNVQDGPSVDELELQPQVEALNVVFKYSNANTDGDYFIYLNNELKKSGKGNSSSGVLSVNFDGLVNNTNYAVFVVIKGEDDASGNPRYAIGGPKFARPNGFSNEITDFNASSCEDGKSTLTWTGITDTNNEKTVYYQVVDLDVFDGLDGILFEDFTETEKVLLCENDKLRHIGLRAYYIDNGNRVYNEMVDDYFIALPEPEKVTDFKSKPVNTANELSWKNPTDDVVYPKSNVSLQSRVAGSGDEWKEVYSSDAEEDSVESMNNATDNMLENGVKYEYRVVVENSKSVVAGGEELVIDEYKSTVFDFTPEAGDKSTQPFGKPIIVSLSKVDANKVKVTLSDNGRFIREHVMIGLPSTESNAPEQLIVDHKGYSEEDHPNQGDERATSTYDIFYESDINIRSLLYIFENEAGLVVNTEDVN